MKISVKAHPKSKKTQVLQKDETHYEVWVRETPEDGKANKAIIQSLSDYLDIPRSRLILLSGQTSRNKIIEIDTLKNIR